MSTLIVSLPPREPAVPLQEWQWPELPFTLVDKAGQVQRAGRAALALLPRALGSHGTGPDLRQSGLNKVIRR